LLLATWLASAEGSRSLLDEAVRMEEQAEERVVLALLNRMREATEVVSSRAKAP